jgi:hypothetical protein
MQVTRVLESYDKNCHFSDLTGDRTSSATWSEGHAGDLLKSRSASTIS